MSDELNVWRDACDLSSYRPLPSASTPDTIAAAVIRDYGDKRYQQAIADVVEWLGERARICDDWEWEEDWIEADACRKAASQITRRFGKDA